MKRPVFSGRSPSEWGPTAPVPSFADDEHLRYLLTAYVFGDLSEAGRSEVEAHLGSCASCREEHEDLRRLSEELSSGLRAEGEPSSVTLDGQRRGAVLEAAKAGGLGRNAWVLGLAAAAIFCTLGGLVLVGLQISGGASDSLVADMSGVTADAPRLEGRNFDGNFARFEKKLGGLSAVPAEPAEDESAQGWHGRTKAAPVPSKRARVQKEAQARITPPTLTLETQELASQQVEAVRQQVLKEAAGLEVPTVETLDAAPATAPALGDTPGRTGFAISQGAGQSAEDASEAESEAAPDVVRFYETAEGVALPKDGTKGVHSLALLDDPASGPEDDDREALTEERKSRAERFGRRPGLEGASQSGEGQPELFDEETGTAGTNATRDSLAITPLPPGELVPSRETAVGGLENRRARLLKAKKAEHGRRDGENGRTPPQLTAPLAPDGAPAKPDEAAEIHGERGPGRSASARRSSRDGGRALQDEAPVRWDDGDGDADEYADLWGDGSLWVGPSRQGGKPSSVTATAEGRKTRGIALPPESRMRAYRYYYDLDPALSYEQFSARPLAIPAPAVGDEGLGRLGFREKYGVNPFVDTQRDHLATFAMDVDTASFTRARDLLRAGKLPQPAQIRVEEFVNYFPQQYPADPQHAFSVFSEGGPSPFGKGLDLLKVTVKARELLPGERKNAVLTFCLDTSGSMYLEDRIELVKTSLHTLVQALAPDDKVGIVAYGAQAYLVLPHTPARERSRVLGAIDSLSPRGSSNVQAGIELAYRLADEIYQERALNRVVLCSDGVATAGARGPEEILKKVKVYAQRGIYLSTVGFGLQKYDDRMMERLANEGNGRYDFISAPQEARRIFQANLPATLQVLAQDAKIQVDFDPSVVGHYRLLGYENRDIADARFRDDTVDAGEVGPGTTVTALFEIQRRPNAHGALGRVFVRYKDTRTTRVEELQFSLAPGVLATRLEDTSQTFKLIASAAECAEILRNSYWARDGAFSRVIALLKTLDKNTRQSTQFQELAEIVQRGRLLSLQNLSNR